MSRRQRRIRDKATVCAENERGSWFRLAPFAQIMVVAVPLDAQFILEFDAAFSRNTGQFLYHDIDPRVSEIEAE
jgi:hypothetical protein